MAALCVLMAVGEAIYRFVGQIGLDTCGGIGGRMYLTQLIAGGLIYLVRLARSKDHAKAHRKHQQKAQDALFHFHHTFLSRILSIRQSYCIKKRSVCQHFFYISPVLF